MSVVKKVLYAITGSERFAVKDTFNGGFYDDPEQDVPQTKDILVEDAPKKRAKKGGAK